uniref:hypothetical protein n=1 Tax=Salmonella enterica TaxID=28901 RepID=UPI003298F1D3
VETGAAFLRRVGIYFKSCRRLRAALVSYTRLKFFLSIFNDLGRLFLDAKSSFLYREILRRRTNAIYRNVKSGSGLVKDDPVAVADRREPPHAG